MPNLIHPGLSALTGVAAYCALAGPLGAIDTETVPALYSESSVFESAIRAEESVNVPPGRITGITVPHHLVVPQLIARGFRAAADSEIRRLIILYPDHFRQVKRSFATTRKHFETPLGLVLNDTDTTNRLLHESDLLDEVDRVGRDHGIQALLPFAAHYFPKAKVVPVCLAINSHPQQWRELTDLLVPMIDEFTIVVQSTDFSHYLPLVTAKRRDQEVLNILASGDITLLERLTQPDHLDSLAAQWIQITLQREKWGAVPQVIGSRNSQEYVPWPVRRTTSYLVQVFERLGEDDAVVGPWPLYDGQSLLYFGGDTFFGRHVARLLREEEASDLIRERILGVTGGHPLIVNLEGVFAPDPWRPADPRQLSMPKDLTMDWLDTLNVVAVAVANNHWHDLGEVASHRSCRALESRGVAVVDQGETRDLGPITLSAFTDLSNKGPNRRRIISPEMVGEAKGDSASRTVGPRVAMVHWGREFQPTAGDRENELSSFFRRNGFEALIGSHPHTQGHPPLEALAGGTLIRAYSLGNLVFDQPREGSGGGLLEMRVFPQGTFFVRWHDLGNLYRDATEAVRGYYRNLRAPDPVGGNFTQDHIENAIP